MSEPVKESAKKEPSLREKLHEAQSALKFRKKHWEQKSLEMVNGRKDSLREALSTTQKQIAELLKARNSVTSSNRQVYDQACAEAASVRDQAIKAAQERCAKEENEARISRNEKDESARESMRMAQAPLDEKYKAEIEGIESDYQKEMKSIEEASKKELRALEQAAEALQKQVDDEDAARTAAYEQAQAAKAEMAKKAIEAEPAAAGSAA